MLIESTGVKNNIHVYDGYIADRDVGKFFSACDLVILPYKSATQSGIAQIAFGFNKPVIATTVGGLPDVVVDGKTGYLVEPCNPQSLADAVITFLEEGNQEMFHENISEEVHKFSWERMCELIQSFACEPTMK